MAYTEEQAAHLVEESSNVSRELQTLMLQTVMQGQTSTDKHVREHVVHGAARRLRTLERGISNIFALFPPSAHQPLPKAVVGDVQVNLHAFLINLSGIFDNWAWAYVMRHQLLERIGDRRGVGLFTDATRKYLPRELRDYLVSKETSGWHSDYLKSFRDALAHRIPPYIPPATFTPEDGEKYNHLESEKIECIKRMDWLRLEEIEHEQPLIGKPCFTFLHSYAEDDAPTVLRLHPQVLSDARTIVEFGSLFLEHWGKYA